MIFGHGIHKKGGATGGGSVESVTGLNTDNIDPANPIVQISVDGATITGEGTPGSPLVAISSGGFWTSVIGAPNDIVHTNSENVRIKQGRKLYFDQ